MYLQTSRLQYNLQGFGVFQTARSDKIIQAFTCSFIISIIYGNAIRTCCPECRSRVSRSTIIQDGKLPLSFFCSACYNVFDKTKYDRGGK